MIPLLRPRAALLGVCLASAALLRAAEPTLEDTVLTSEHLDSRSTDKEVRTLLWDNVVITATNLRVTCDRAEIVTLRSGDAAQLVAKENRFKSMLLTGHVTIFQRDSNRTATCGRAEILPVSDKITLDESPKVVDLDKDGKPELTWTGDELVLHRGERHITGTNIRISAPPVKDLGFDKSRPAPLPTPAPTAPAPKPDPLK